MFPSYLDLAKEITAIRGCALLNLFEIDATDMNQNMSTHASGLRDDLIKWQVNFYKPEKIDQQTFWVKGLCIEK